MLPGGIVRLFDATPLRLARTDYANMDDNAERHYTEESQQS
jgi:hypothetical protein